MVSYRTTARVEESGRIVVQGIPFAAGDEVEVIVALPDNERRRRIDEWRALLKESQMYAAAQGVTDDDIERAIVESRAGR
jgi:hypothetical protein